jgi:hypothetical protein
MIGSGVLHLDVKVVRFDIVDARQVKVIVQDRNGYEAFFYTQEGHPFYYIPKHTCCRISFEEGYAVQNGLPFIVEVKLKKIIGNLDNTGIATVAILRDIQLKWCDTNYTQIKYSGKENVL